MGNEIVPAARVFGLPDLQIMAQSVAQSRLFPGIESEQAALCLMLLCESEGLHPMQALRRFHVIEGKPSMRADAMQAEFQRRGGLVRWGKSNAQVCEASFVHPVHAPDPGVTITLALQELVDSGVATCWSKQENDWVLKKNYRQFPKSMLRARVISEGVRMVDPGVVVGIYTPEEIDDRDVIDVTPRPDRKPLPRHAPDPAPSSLPSTKQEINETFRPAAPANGKASERAANDRERIKLGGDRIGAKGVDVRAWDKLTEDEVGAANMALKVKRTELDLEGAEATNAHEVTRHMVKWTIAQGAEDPEPAGPDGKKKRVGIGKLNLHLHQLYQAEGWRDPMRKEFKRYVSGKLKDALQVADNEAHGDGAMSDQVESQEAATKAEDESQLAPVEAGEGDWGPGRE
jgi:hypothetical protein